KDVVCLTPNNCRTCYSQFTKTLELPNAVDGDHYTNRRLINAALLRADEPAEFLAYWISRFGRNNPVPPIAVKRALADAATRLYNQFAYLKWDSDARSVSMADVIDMTQPAYHHPDIRGTWQYDLFG